MPLMPLFGDEAISWCPTCQSQKLSHRYRADAARVPCSPSSCARLHRKILADIEWGLDIKNDLVPEAHREAERLLMAIDAVALRAADALHLALGSLSGASAIVTYDLRLAKAAIRIGLNSLP